MFLITFLFIPSANAAPIGNPETLGGFGEFSVGGGHDSSHQDLTINGGRQVVEFGGETYAFSFPLPTVSASRAQINTQTEFIVGTLGIHKKADVYAGFGVARTKTGFDLNYVNGVESHNIKDNSTLPWMVGMRVNLWEIAGVDVGGTVQYSSLDMNGRYEMGNRDLSIMFPGNVSYSTKTEIRKWQAALTAHTHIWVLDPYAGATYMKISAKNLTTISAPANSKMSAYTFRVNMDAEQEHNVGIVIGTGIKLPVRGLSVNLEHRMLNERATTASLSYQF